MRNAEGLESAAVPVEPEVFELLGNDIRLRIVRELCTAEPGCAVPFSRLRERVGVRDSGKFNYHLGRLRGPLVEKREDGYALTAAGRAVGALCGEEPVAEPAATE